MTSWLEGHLGGNCCSVDTAPLVGKDTACWVRVWLQHVHQGTGVFSAPCIRLFLEVENKQLCDSPDGLCLAVSQKRGSPGAMGPGMSPEAFSETSSRPGSPGWGLACVLEKPPIHTVSGTALTLGEAQLKGLLHTHAQPCWASHRAVASESVPFRNRWAITILSSRKTRPPVCAESLGRQRSVHPSWPPGKVGMVTPKSGVRKRGSDWEPNCPE